MSTLYEVIVYSDPSDPILEDFFVKVQALIEPFGLEMGREFAWTVNPKALTITQTVPSAVLYLGAANAPEATTLLNAKIPI